MRECEWAAQGKATKDALRELAEVRCGVLRAYSAWVHVCVCVCVCVCVRVCVCVCACVRV